MLDSTPFAASDVEVYDRDDLHAQLAWRRLYVCYTVGPATPANIDSLVRNFRKFAIRTTGPIGFALLTRQTTKPPDGEARKKVQDCFATFRDRLQCVAICIEADGFTGAIIRSVASSLFVLSQPGLNVKFFSKTADSIPWVAEALSLESTNVGRTYSHVRSILL